ncbi:MAG TPA: pilus assembly protein N-terminal domain-containing protein [Gemmatimonadaceae bacterium]|nr:pilus assembly protein N-terminal domain-containing protein [Gemmatimonadaceae bacterium]
MEVRLKALATFRKLSLIAGFALAILPALASAQSGPVVRIDLPVGRSYPLTTPVGITKVSIANPDVADVVVVGTRELVINSKAQGETDAIFWLANATRLHYRISVHSPSDRSQIALYIKIAEVRKDFSRQYGLSGLYRNRGTRIGTGTFNTDNAFDQQGNITLPQQAGFLTVLTDFGTKNLLGLLDAEEATGKAKTLAEPNILAGNKDTATFLAGGEIPIPIIQPGEGAVTRVTIQYKEFGVRLRFVGEILSDSLIKINVTPEVSSLDFVNGVDISGFRIPAFRTRRVSTTVDVRRDQSMIISGLFNNEQEKVKTGLPWIKDLPVIGELFSSTRWINNESELLVVVTPVIVDPLDPRPQDVLKLLPDTALPARDAIKKRLDDASKRPPSPIIR